MAAEVRVIPKSGDHLFPAHLELAVREIRVQADIGIYPHEIGRPQELVIDIILAIAAPGCDGIDATLDYEWLVDAVQRLAKERISLIETFARRLGEDCMLHPGVRRATIAVTKPAALANGVATATVVIDRRNQVVRHPCSCQPAK